MSERLQGADVEIIDTRSEGIVVPNMVRINGQEVLIPAGADIDIDSINSQNMVTVRLTMIVRSLSIRHEDASPEDRR